MTTSNCEFAAYGPPPCGARASWVVAVGSRKSDAQRSCGRHLNRTCEIMQAAENRAGVRLTVVPVSQWAAPAEDLAALADVLDLIEVPQ